MFFGAYAAVHGFITLMKYQLHVVLTHVIGVFDALVTFAFGDIRLGCAGECGKRNHAGNDDDC